MIKRIHCLIKHHVMKRRRKWSRTPCILNLITGWRWAVSFTPWALYSRRKEPLVSIG